VSVNALTFTPVQLQRLYSFFSTVAKTRYPADITPS
jgi:hypothetical protein